MANDYEDDFFNESNQWKSHAPTNHQESKYNGYASSSHDRRSIKSKEEVKSSAKPPVNPQKDDESDEDDDEDEEEDDRYDNKGQEFTSTNGTNVKESAHHSNKRNGGVETQVSYAPSNYDYEDTFVSDSVVGHTHSVQEQKRTPASKNKLLIKKPKFRQKADQSSNAEPSTVQRLLSAKNTKLHEYINRIHELENALQQVHNENKLLSRLQKIQEKEITHFQHDQEEIPRLMQHHSAEVKAVKMMLDKARGKHQKTWKRLLDVENLLREEKQRSEQLQQIVDSRDLKERYDLDRKLSQATETIEVKDKRIIELESHLARLEKNFSRQLISEKSKTKELQLLLEDLQNRNVKLEFSLKEKEKELSIRDIYRQRAIQEPKTQLVPIGASSSTASSPGFTSSTGNIAASNPRKPQPPPPRKLPPTDAQASRHRKPPKPQPQTTAAPANANNSRGSDAQIDSAPELGSKGFFITQVEMEVARATADQSQTIETAVAAYSPRQATVSKKYNPDPLRASDQRRREQETEIERHLAAEKAAQQELLRKQEQEKAEEERRKREEEIKRRQILMAETDTTRKRQQQQQKEEEERQRLKAEAEREEQKRKDAEANDRALKVALEAQRQQRANQERREKRDWQDAEEKRIKEQVLAKTNARKLEWLSPSPDNEDDDNDLLNFGGSKRTTVPARNAKKLDLLFSDDDDDAGFGSIKSGGKKTTGVIEKLHNGIPTHDGQGAKNGNGVGNRPRAGAMAPFMLGDSRDMDSDFLFGPSDNSNRGTNKIGGGQQQQQSRGITNISKPPPANRTKAGGGFQQTHLFGVESPDPVAADFGIL